MRCIVMLEDPDANPVNSPHAKWEGEAPTLQDAIALALDAYPGFRYFSSVIFYSEI